MGDLFTFTHLRPRRIIHHLRNGKPQIGAESLTTHQQHQLKPQGSHSWPTWVTHRSLVPLTSMRSFLKIMSAILTIFSAFGNSLSYVTPNGRTVAAESLPFDGTLDTSETELVVLSDKECDEGCTYWRPDATSHCTSPLPLSPMLLIPNSSC
jgi:hypothetical protein